jgi:hypothetical protein
MGVRLVPEKSAMNFGCVVLHWWSIGDESANALPVGVGDGDCQTEGGFSSLMTTIIVASSTSRCSRVNES